MTGALQNFYLNRRQNRWMKTNIEIILELYANFDRGDFDRVRELLAEDFLAHLAGMPIPLDRDKFTTFGLEFRQAFPDGTHQFGQAIAAGENVITQGVFRGTHLAKFQGLPATGKSIEIAIMHIDRVSNDRVLEHWGQGDQLGMMQQLGIAFFPSINLFYSALTHQLGLDRRVGF